MVLIDKFRLIRFKQSLSHSCAGFTLIEMIITIILLGASTMIIFPFFNAITHSPDPIIRQRAVAIGQAMMDEILAKRWDENTHSGGGPIPTNETADSGTCLAGNRIQCFRDTPNNSGYAPTDATAPASLGPDGAELAGLSRALYDDVDDYAGYTETGFFRDQNDVIVNLAGYTRSVAVVYIASTTNTINIVDATTVNATYDAGQTTDSKLIVVTVTSTLGENFYFTTVKCNL